MHRYDLSDFLSIPIDFKLNLKKKNKSVLKMISIHSDFIFHNNTSYEISKGNRDFIIIIFLVHLFHLQNHIFSKIEEKKIFFSHNFQQVWVVWHISWWSSIHCWLWTIFNSTLSLKISFWCILMGVICGSFNKVWLEMPSNTMSLLSSSTIKSILG